MDIKKIDVGHVETTALHPAYVTMMLKFFAHPNEGVAFAHVDAFVLPDAARELAINLLKSADQADGGQGWQERLADALGDAFQAGQAGEGHA